MNEDNTFIFHGKWIKNINKLPIEVQDKILADIVRFGTKQETKHDSDNMVASVVNMIKDSIEKSVSDYEAKVAMSKGAGRKKKVNDEMIYLMAREGKNSTEIAKSLGLSKSSIDKSAGWRYRKIDGWTQEEFCKN